MAKRLIPSLGVLGLALALSLAPQPAEAQLTRGALSGTVVDTTGAAVPGASVTSRNVATNITRTAVTDANGFYRIPALEPGRYSVAVAMPGFSRVENRDIEVRTTQEVTFDVTVKVSTMTETVDVTAEAGAVLLNKSNPTIGMTATGRQAVDLPLSAGRAVTNLALLSPNVSYSVNAGDTALGATNISANGQRSRNNNFTIDGSDNNDISVTLQTTPVFPEAVAEFQVQTNAYNAEFGRNSGAQLNIITRSGTNAFHGDLFEYYRGSTLNAMDNLEKASGRTDPARSNRNQAGFTLGGPIQRDKTFFFLLAQVDRTRSSGTLGDTISLPTQAGFTSLGSVPLAPGQSQASRQAVLNNLQFLNDVYGRGLTFRNVRTTPVNGVPVEIGSVNVPRSQPNNAWNILARLDHRFGEADSATARLVYNDAVTENLTSNTNFGALFAAQQATKDLNLAVSETHIFSGTFLNEARFSWIRRNLQFPENDPDSPSATITGFFTIGGLSNFPQGRVQNSFQFSDVATMHRGKHAIKFGADIRRVVLDNEAAFDSKGTFTFSNFQDYMNNTAARFAQALADRELHRPAVADVLVRPGRLPGEPGADPERRPALRDQRRALRILRRHRSREPGRHGARPDETGHGQHRAASGLQLEPALEQPPHRGRPHRLPRRLRAGLRRALLQHPDRQRVQLPARGRRRAVHRPRPLPEPRPGLGRRGVQPARHLRQHSRRRGEPRVGRLQPLHAA